MHSTGSSLNKKYTRQNAVLTKEKLDETGVRSEYSPCRSLTWLAQKAQVSTTVL
jgi:hypothetical protein